jgi:hypothetical protein
VSYRIASDEEALRLRKAAPSNRKRLQEIERERKALDREREVLREDLYVGERVRIHKGRPYWSPYGDFESLDGTRRARFNQRAVDELFNVELNVLRDSGFFGTAKSVLKVTESHARKLCMDWALDGTYPGIDGVS